VRFIPTTSIMPNPSARHTKLPTGASPVKGVFSIDSDHFLGKKSLGRITQRVFVYAEEEEEGRVSLQTLSRNFIPAGPKRIIAKDRLLTDYLPEPSIYINKVVPVMGRMQQSLTLGDQHRQKLELFSAEFEYKNVLRLDEEHVKATFGLGLTYLERQEVRSANIVFRKIMMLDAAFQPEHKHLFNEFGIKMRKLGMYDEAIQYYIRAFRLCRTDEHLLYNIARTLYEKGRIKSARMMLARSLRLNPEFREAMAFMAYLESRERDGAPARPPFEGRAGSLAE